MRWLFYLLIRHIYQGIFNRTFGPRGMQNCFWCWSFWWKMFFGVEVGVFKMPLCTNSSIGLSFAVVKNQWSYQVILIHLMFKWCYLWRCCIFSSRLPKKWNWHWSATVIWDFRNGWNKIGRWQSYKPIYCLYRIGYFERKYSLAEVLLIHIPYSRNWVVEVDILWLMPRYLFLLQEIGLLQWKYFLVIFLISCVTVWCFQRQTIWYYFYNFGELKDDSGLILLCWK